MRIKLHSLQNEWRLRQKKKKTAAECGSGDGGKGPGGAAEGDFEVPGGPGCESAEQVQTVCGVQRRARWVGGCDGGGCGDGEEVF